MIHEQIPVLTIIPICQCCSDDEGQKDIDRARNVSANVQQIYSGSDQYEVKSVHEPIFIGGATQT